MWHQLAIQPAPKRIYHTLYVLLTETPVYMYSLNCFSELKLHFKLRRHIVMLILVCGLRSMGQKALGQDTIIDCPDGPRVTVIDSLFISASSVDVLPQYGKIAWPNIPQWLSNKARHYNRTTSGTSEIVIVNFTIDRTGRLVNPTVKGYSGVILYTESLRLVSSLGRFEPGRIGNKPVDTQVSLGLEFKLPTSAQKND